MVEYWKWLNENAGAMGLLLAALPFLWAGWRYLSQKRQELRSQRFEVYHKLLKELVVGDSAGTYLDRQIAIIFELRRFTEYHEVTLRILQGLRDTWGERPDAQNRLQRILEELDISINYIEVRRSPLCRAFATFGLCTKTKTAV